MVDAAQGIEAQTLANVYLALAQDLVIVPVLNKIDLPSAQPDVVIEELENVLAIPREEVIMVCAKDGTNVDLRCWRRSWTGCPAPKGDPEAPLQGLIFDSHYDAYKGVVAYVRLAAGHARANETRSGSWVSATVPRSWSWACSGRSWCRCRRSGRARWATWPRASSRSATARSATR